MIHQVMTHFSRNHMTLIKKKRKTEINKWKKKTFNSIQVFKFKICVSIAEAQVYLCPSHVGQLDRIVMFQSGWKQW